MSDRALTDTELLAAEAIGVAEVAVTRIELLLVAIQQHSAIAERTIYSQASTVFDVALSAAKLEGLAVEMLVALRQRVAPIVACELQQRQERGSGVATH